MGFSINQKTEEYATTWTYDLGKGNFVLYLCFLNVSPINLDGLNGNLEPLPIT